MIYETEEARDYLLERAEEYHIDVKWKHFSPTTPPNRLALVHFILCLFRLI